MPRVLSPDERALWRRVTADMRRAEAEAEADVIPPAKAMPATQAEPTSTSVRRAVAAARPRALPVTLDARWDRKLRDGDLTPDRVVDLHGHRLDTAHALAIAALEGAVREGARVVLIVTGNAPPATASRLDAPLRGIIRASLVDWIAASPVVDRIAAIRPAHPRHGGAGAVYVVMRRDRAPKLS